MLYNSMFLVSIATDHGGVHDCLAQGLSLFDLALAEVFELLVFVGLSGVLLELDGHLVQVELFKVVPNVRGYEFCFFLKTSQQHFIR